MLKTTILVIGFSCIFCMRINAQHHSIDTQFTMELPEALQIIHKTEARYKELTIDEIILSRKNINENYSESEKYLDAFATYIHEKVHSLNNLETLSTRLKKRDDLTYCFVRGVQSKICIRFNESPSPVDTTFYNDIDKSNLSYFSTYLSCNIEAGCPDAQTRGLPGLIDEYIAYYFGSYANYQIIKHSIEHKLESIFILTKMSFRNVLTPSYEFKLYILNYLNQIKTENTELYHAIIKDTDFQTLYCWIDHKYNLLKEDYEVLYKDFIANLIKQNSDDINVELNLNLRLVEWEQYEAKAAYLNDLIVKFQNQHDFECENQKYDK